MKVTFILADLHSELEIGYRNRRSVTIDLIPEQQMQIGKKFVGICNGEPQYEVIMDCFVES